jgi:thiol:disulfide interchange protein DsbD
LAYALGIMLTFTGIGLGVSLVFGATGVQQLAANVWVNLGLAALFIALALNLFGVYEIGVPSSWINKLNNKGGKAQGLVGPILMGLAFSLTSFTCTVPFAGTVLASAATGDVFYPALGMLAFSFAFALPFFLLAMFPQYLAKLPKSGTWLVSVKAYMGFLELAFAFKFLSNVDLVFGWGLLTREAFLAVWVAILTLASVYLLGWMKLPHDGDTKIGWPRFAFGLVNFGVAAYLLGAIQGAPMGPVSAFLPPVPYPGREGKASDLAWHKSLEPAQAEATAEGKLVFLDFTGVTCANCRVMEQEFFPLPEIRTELENFARAKLFTDRNTPADNANAALREELTRTSTNPVYVIMTPEKKVLRVYQGLAPNPRDFVTFLRGASTVAQAE